MKIEAESVRVDDSKLSTMTTKALIDASRSMLKHLPSNIATAMQAEITESIKTALKVGLGAKQDMNAGIHTEGFDFSNKLAKFSSLSFQTKTNLHIKAQRGGLDETSQRIT